MKLKKRWIALLLVLISVGIYSYFAFFAKTPIYYLTDSVKTQNLEVTILADGKLEASKQVDVGAQVSGQIRHLHVELGDTVKKGELIAEIDDLPQQNALKDSEARLKHAIASKVAKEAQIVNARITLERQKRLIQQKATTQADVDVADANLKILEAELDSLEAQIAQAQIALDSAKLDLDYTKIVSPMDGVVVATLVKEGQTVNSVQSAPTIVKIANLDLMTIKAQVSEADITKIAPGMDAYFTILGNPHERYPAKLESLEPATETFQLTVGNTLASTAQAIYYNGVLSVDNSEHIFRIDMTTQVYIITDSVKDKPVIPAMATRFKPSNMNEFELPKITKENETIVWVKHNNTIMPKKVELGISNNILTEVISGLSVNDEIVLAETTEAASATPKKMPRMR